MIKKLYIQAFISLVVFIAIFTLNLYSGVNAQAFISKHISKTKTGVVNSLNVPDSFLFSSDRGTTNSSVTLEFFKGRLYVFHRGDDQKIYYEICRVSTGIDDASCGTVRNIPGSTSQPIGLANFNNKLVLTHRGDDSKIYFSHSENGESWTGWQEYGGLTESMPTMTVFKNELYVTHRGQNNSVYFRRTYNLTTWTPWIERPAVTNDFVGIGADQNQICLVHRGLDSKINTTCSRDAETWYDWSNTNWGITERGITMTPIPYTDGNSDLLQFHRGNDQRIYFRFYPDLDWTSYPDNLSTDEAVFAASTREPVNMIATGFRGNDRRIYFTVEYLDI
jgi:hypothetical protein